MDIIEIDNLRLRTVIGFSAHELEQPQEVVISLRIGTSARLAGESDRPQDACNYKTITKAVIQQVENTRYALVEKLAEDIARCAIIDCQAAYIEVRAHKPGALRRADSVGIRIQRRPQDYARNLAYVSLGSNIAPVENLPKAVQLLRNYTSLLALSSVYRTAPQGDTAQAPFLNMAVKAHTLRSPLQFKTQVLDRIEAELKRIRDPQNKNAPRTIDLDISLWNSDILTYGSRPWQIPDADITRFAHVAIPLADLNPDYIHPTAHKTLRAISRALPAADVQKLPLDFSPARF